MPRRRDEPADARQHGIDGALTHLATATHEDLATTLHSDLETLRRGLGDIARVVGTSRQPPGSKLPDPDLVLAFDIDLTLGYWQAYYGGDLNGLETHIAYDPDHGRRCIAEVHALAREVKQRTRRTTPAVTIGDCPACGRAVRVRTTARVPVPSTSEQLADHWTTIPAVDPTAWTTTRVRHVCGVERTLADWHRSMVGQGRPLTAVDLVAELHRRLGVRHSPATIRVWAHRGHLTKRGTTKTGHALYDLHEVLAYVVQRSATVVDP